MLRSNPGIAVQPRDRHLLAEVGRFRVVTGEHLRHLVFPTVSVRMANRRLALLVSHGLLSRHYLPDLEAGLVLRSRRPLYSLTRSGAELVGPGLWPAVRFVPSAWAVTRHNLIATDLLVAVEAAARAAGLRAEGLPEPELRRRLRAHNWSGNRFPAAVLPDGALTIGRTGSEPISFCVEVVRAGMRGGNRTLAAKMGRYVELNRRGFFREVHGLARLRAVLVVTTSPGRATTLVQLASRLPYGRNLFWATSYERRTSFGMTFEPNGVLGPLFHDLYGKPRSLFPHLPTL